MTFACLSQRILAVKRVLDNLEVSLVIIANAEAGSCKKSVELELITVAIRSAFFIPLGIFAPTICN
jgi:hypothetical protein